MVPGKPSSIPLRALPAKGSGFTIVELMVSVAVLAILLALVGAVMSATTRTVRSATAKLDAYPAARAAFSQLTQRLSTATLNTYWDYDSRTNPTRYVRKSDLHFVVGRNGNYGSEVFFQSPESISAAFGTTQGMLNACGFFVAFGNDKSAEPEGWSRPDHIVQDRHRYRLMQAVQLSDDLGVFQVADASWTNALRAGAWPVAENVIALVVWPRRSQEDAVAAPISPDYTYDSRSGPDVQRAQLPPVLQVTMIVLEKASAERIAVGSAPPSVIEGLLAGKFASAAFYESDLQEIEEGLRAAGLNYEVLTSTVVLRESKWSEG